MKKILLSLAVLVSVFAAFKFAYAQSNPFNVIGNALPTVGYAFGGGQVLSSERYGGASVGTGNNFRGLVVDIGNLYTSLTPAPGTAGKLNYTAASNSATLNNAANHKDPAPQRYTPAGTVTIGNYTCVFGPWRLPTKAELLTIYTNRAVLGIGNTGWFWSSTPGSANHVWTHNFANGNTYDYLNYYTCNIRAVRSFDCKKN